MDSARQKQDSGDRASAFDGQEVNATSPDCPSPGRSRAIDCTTSVLAVDPGQPTTPGAAMNLADVIAQLDAADLAARAKRALRWAINTFCNGLGLAPIDVRADARAIRSKIERLSPAMMGIEPRTFENIM